MEVSVKTYLTAEGANRDAKLMAAQGWQPQSTTGGGTHFAPGRGLRKSAGTGVTLGLFGLPPALGLLGNRKKWRESDPIIVTWVREPGATSKCAITTCSEKPEIGDPYCDGHAPLFKLKRGQPAASKVDPDEVVRLAEKVRVEGQLPFREQLRLTGRQYAIARQWYLSMQAEAE